MTNVKCTSTFWMFNYEPEIKCIVLRAYL